MRNRTPVFRSTDWHSPAPNVWEAQAQPGTVAGRPPFEAACWTTFESGQLWWTWQLHRPPDDNPYVYLLKIADGRAPTLHDAQNQADVIAQRWRDNPDGMAERLIHRPQRPSWCLACSSCGTTHRLSELIGTGWRCPTTTPDGPCGSVTFERHQPEQPDQPEQETSG